ncbi:MAG: riboflavin synthase [Neomegalonema sp.]|nr:riboflavin synthase [Neomegalonema sp.]
MFTGIVTDIGEIRAVEPLETGLRARIACGYDLSNVDIGASIACSGVCLTVTSKDVESGSFDAEISAETLSKTTLGEWKAGTKLNLERSLRIGDELGGHIVSGHVDRVGAVAVLQPEGESLRVFIDAPRALAPFIATKGSIAIDGCSMTVNSVEDTPEACRFGVNVIPHTQSATTLGRLCEGARVNLEIDMLARYVQRMNVAA